jgi:antitoxin VapB
MEIIMQTAKLFTDGHSQAVRLPKEYRFSGDEIYIKKFENMVILLTKENPWASLVNSLDQFSDDFMEDRNQPIEQIREDF